MSDNLPASTPSSRVPAVSAEDAEWIGGAVHTLLSFYYVPGEDQRVVAAQGRMWVEDLRGFPRHVIEAALRDWRRSETRRPTPADIIKLCRSHMPRPRIVAEPQTVREITPEAKARIAGMLGGAFPELKRIPRE
jgi:hypothetical protein